MRARVLSTASLLLALAACGGPLLFAELELPSVEVTLPQYQFPGSVAGAPVVQTASFDLGVNVPVINQSNVTIELKLNKMTIVLNTSGPLSNFDQIDSVTITALPPPGSTLPRLVLIDYTNPHTATGVTSVTATSQTATELKPYLDAGKITVEARYAGTGLPTSPWTADVTADFWIKVKLDYGTYVKG
jgi:hypothetical protein